MGQGSYDLDSVLDEIGNFGSFQFITFTLLCIPMFFNAIFTLSYVFTASSVDQRCWINGCDNENSLYLPSWINNSMPVVNDIPAKCSQYQDMNITDHSLSEGDFCPADLFNKSDIIKCNKFIYKTEERTIATEWNLACPEDEWKLTLVGTINNIGQFVGMPLGGYISDRYGRRTSLAFAGTCSAVFGIIRSFSIDYTMFIIFEFLDACFGSVLYSAAVILGIELVGPDKRVLASTVMALFYPVGEVVMGVVAKFVSNWRTFLRVLYIPGLIHVFYFWIIPESIRWLFAQGKYDRAVNVLHKAAKFNKAPIREESLAQLYKAGSVLNDDPNESSSENYPLWPAFKSRILLWRIVNCSFCWLTNTFVYYGLSLNSVSLAGDKYLNFILVCMVEIPGFLITYFAMNLTGRRFSQSGSMLISGIACIASLFVSEDQSWIMLGLFLIGKLAITISFTVLYVYTTELFPTNLRHSLMSFCSMFGRIGSMIAPQTPLMAQLLPSLPLILFGGSAIVSGLLVLKFPETLNTKLPTTILDAEQVGDEESKDPL